jgi:plasmid stabilization system protein ParE
LNLRYSPAALDDLRRIRAYLRDELAQPQSAQRIPADIVRRSSLLKNTPLLGPALQPRVRRPTDLRYLVCGSHLAFYRVGPDTIFVLRVLHARQDFIRALGLDDDA